MATTPLRISSAVVSISLTKRIQSLLKPFENASKAFGHSKRKVLLHSEHFESPMP
jgi:hypothetical protein